MKKDLSLTGGEGDPRRSLETRLYPRIGVCTYEDLRKDVPPNPEETLDFSVIYGEKTFL